MRIVCRLGNHVATFMEGSWGVCGAMVCSWIKTLRTGVTVSAAHQIGAVGSMILAQHQVMRAADEDQGRATLFRLYGLNLQNRFDLYAAGNHALFTPRRLAEAALAPGFAYLSIAWWDEAKDEPAQHAIGTWSRPAQNRWQLCDPNFYIWEFDTQAEFVGALTSLLSGDGVPPDVESGPYPVVSGSIYYLT